MPRVQTAFVPRSRRPLAMSRDVYFVFYAVLVCAAASIAAVSPPPPGIPTFHVDPNWPKPLPNHWIVGAVVGVSVDRRDHVWIVHRPSTLQPNETRSIWRAAPPVLEFDQDGTLLRSWGGPGSGYEWPELEHGVFVDANDNVWLCAGGDRDAHILKFTADGRFLQQIGRQGGSRGSNDVENFGAPAQVVVDEDTVLELRPLVAMSGPAPRPQQRSILIKFEHRRRRTPDRTRLVRLQGRRPMDDPHMIAPVDGYADDGADDPVIGERLRPIRIHVERRDGRKGRTHGGDRRGGVNEDGKYEAAYRHARHYRRSLRPLFH